MKIIRIKAKDRPKEGRVHIRSSFSNTMITATDVHGNAIAWASTAGFQKTTSPEYAAENAAKNVGNALKKVGIERVEVIVKGPGKGREATIRALQNMGFEITLIKDVTPIPHNGCRPIRHRRGSDAL